MGTHTGAAVDGRREAMVIYFRVSLSKMAQNGRVLLDFGGHSAFRGTTGTPFDASHKVEQKCTLALRSVRVMAVVYVFNREGSDFW